MKAITKNNNYKAVVEDYTHEGMGIVKIDGYPVFLPDVLKGESVEFKAVKVNSKYAFGRVLKVLEESPNRQTPPCEYYFQCGGCQIQVMNDAEQASFKRQVVGQNINQQARLNLHINDTVTGDSLYYRNKSQIPVQKIDGEVVMGFYKPRSHDIVDIEHCYIQKHVHNDIMMFIKDKLIEENTSIYDEKSHEGLLRHLVIRSNNDDSELQVVFITNGKRNEFLSIVKALKEKFPNVKSIVQNINDEKTNVIFGRRSIVLSGHDYITDTVLGKSFKIRDRSFYQVNHEQTEKLYQIGLDMAGLNGDETIIDTYSGIGSIGLTASGRVSKIIGIEVVESAVEDAKENAKLNGIDNADYYLGKAEEVMPKLVKEGVSADVVFVDPPRKGCHTEFLDALIEVAPKKIVYISCNPGTLQRDMKYLDRHGFKATEVTPVDLFPQTKHIEAVTVLENTNTL
ncbi:MAG: 23S rRNA (uracil(1939)-C(5))-methyltransferase RlmD [Jeotgalicoccus sp.]|nr:23S rRNA (uracil(1939)-C(5))-methyltransferase RlmD [Jeotgalicoccus sp.]